LPDAAMPAGAVVVRSPDGELELQGLRTALSLALGDRPASLYVFAPGVSLLSAAADSEAGRCLLALKEAAIPLVVEARSMVAGDGVQEAPRAAMLESIALAAFQQTF